MDNHHQQIELIIARNQRVEADKAWEMSWFRRILIAAFTYVAACAFLTLVNGDHTRAYLPALVPTVAYILSTLTLGPIKDWWVSKRLKS